MITDKYTCLMQGVKGLKFIKSNWGEGGQSGQWWGKRDRGGSAQLSVELLRGAKQQKMIVILFQHETRLCRNILYRNNE